MPSKTLHAFTNAGAPARAAANYAGQCTRIRRSPCASENRGVGNVNPRDRDRSQHGEGASAPAGGNSQPLQEIRAGGGQNCQRNGAPRLNLSTGLSDHLPDAPGPKAGHDGSIGGQAVVAGNMETARGRKRKGPGSK